MQQARITKEEQKLIDMLTDFTEEAKRNHPRISVVYVTPKQHKMLMKISDRETETTRSQLGIQLSQQKINGYRILVAK